MMLGCPTGPMIGWWQKRRGLSIAGSRRISNTHVYCMNAIQWLVGRLVSFADAFGAYADQTRDSGGDTTMSCYVQSNLRDMAMTHQTQDQESIVMINSVTTRSTLSNTTCYHVASTSEGCWISRDKEIGFVVSCGKDSLGSRHVPTLPAAYALCQQLMPRRHFPLSQA